jgi:hypothetical protein
MKTTTAVILFAAIVCTMQAEPRERKSKHESHNYIIERQQIGAVKGPPTSRLIIGRREVDIYPNGLMFEKNNVVGVKGRK